MRIEMLQDMADEELRMMAIVPEYMWVKAEDSRGNIRGYWEITGWGLVPASQVAPEQVRQEREKGITG